MSCPFGDAATPCTNPGAAHAVVRLSRESKLDFYSINIIIFISDPQIISLQTAGIAFSRCRYMLAEDDAIIKLFPEHSMISLHSVIPIKMAVSCSCDNDTR